MQASDLPFHPVAIKFGILDGAECDALVNDIKTSGQKVPIVLHNGVIIDGIQRYRACLKAKVEPIFTEFGGEEKDIVRFIARMNMYRRHLSTKRKKEIAKELLKADPTISDLAISKTTQLSDKTVTQVRADAVRRSEIPNVTVRSDTKGREQPAEKHKRPANNPQKNRQHTAAKAGSQVMPGQIGPVMEFPEQVAESLDAAAGLQWASTILAEKLRTAEIRIVGLESEVEELKAENAKLLEQLEAARAAGRITRKPPFLDDLEVTHTSN
jgi:ParB-like chromosome segregation protein Spo0J